MAGFAAWVCIESGDVVVGGEKSTSDVGLPDLLDSTGDGDPVLAIPALGADIELKW